ncbi:MAG: ABC transporter ATP-binding protein [Lachnospiraceae bacterium]|nr:ABC transporter ATP-binding protein [Lachnospiraceae bacterium]
MKKLLAYLKNYKKECVLAPLFKMLEATFELIVPLAVSAVIDVGIAEQDRNFIWKMSLLMVALGLIGLLCSVTAQYFAAKAAAGFGTGVRHALFAHIQTFSFSEIDRAGTATLITRMTSDINQVQSGVNMVLRLFLRSPFIVFGAMVMAFTIDVKAALIFAVTIPLLSLVVFGIMAVSIPLYRKVQERLDKVLGITRENLTGARVIRAFHKEEEEKRRFEEGLESLTSMQNYVGKISAFLNPLTFIMINAATIVLLYTGAVQVNIGSLTQGEVVALVNYMSQILVELIKLANLIITITKAAACGKRISSILEMKSSMPAEQTGGKAFQPVNRRSPMVQFSHVGMAYQGAGAESLSDIDFSVEKGETVGVIGGTGSGKTTLVHLIPRFYDATAGEVLIQGKNVKEFSLEELRQKVGIVMQKAVLFQGTIRENLCWGKADATDQELFQALDTAQAREVVEGKEGKLDAPVEQGGKNFSGGQRQRLTIARALVRKPEILILDDSASALDYATDARLRKAIREMEGTPTVFIVSQRTSSIQHADKIIVLDDGEIAGMGTHEELLQHCQVYQEIHESQFKNQ